MLAKLLGSQGENMSGYCPQWVYSACIGLVIKDFIEKDIPLVEEVSASNKLKEFINTKTTYNERKKASIKFTLDILSQNNDINQWLSFFNSHKKKDDLADCFLQGRWYLNKNLLKKK